MARSRRSLEISDAYRVRVAQLAAHARQTARQSWQAAVGLADIDRGYERWLTQVVPSLTQVQLAGVRLSAAYLAAYLASELERPVTPGQPDDSRVGRAEDGQPLGEALAASAITIKTLLAQGRTPAEALAGGLDRATRLAGSAAISAPRAALASGIQTDERIVGWRRVTSGTACLACLAAADRGYQKHQPMHVHPACDCTSEPVVRDVPDRVTRPTGSELFDRLTPEQQARRYGAEKAALVRERRVPFRDLIAVSPMETTQDLITERPLDELQALAH